MMISCILSTFSIKLKFINDTLLTVLFKMFGNLQKFGCGEIKKNNLWYGIIFQFWNNFDIQSNYYFSDQKILDCFPDKNSNSDQRKYVTF